MPHVISVVQSKGGTGKTTVTMFLATAMQKKGYKVAVLDSDPQQSAMRWSSASEEPLPFPTLPAPSPSELSEALHRAKKADFVLIDTPPGNEKIIDAAVSAASLVLVPTGVSPMEMDRTQITLDALAKTTTPVAVVLTNVDRREKLADTVHAELVGDETMALADVVIPTRATTRKAFGTVPDLNEPWKALATELCSAFED